MIRQLTHGDVKEYRRIRLEGLLHDPGAFMMKYSDWAKRPLADFAARLETMRVFAAFKADRIIGTIGLEDDNDNPDIGWIVEVYLNRDFRGQGLADKLMQHALMHPSYTQLRLEVAEANQAALALYQRHGFTHRERSKEDLSSKIGSVCEILMVRAIK